MKRSLFLGAVSLCAVFCACTTQPPAPTVESSVPVTEAVSETSAAETAAAAVTTETTTVTTAETTAETVLYDDDPEGAYNALMDVLPRDPYPDDYAGAYSYFGKLYICTTSADAPDYCKGLLDNYTCITVRQVGHSLNYLEETADQAAKLLMDKFTVSECYADIPSNKAAVTVVNADLKAVRQYIESLPDLPFSVSELTFILEERETEAVVSETTMSEADISGTAVPEASDISSATSTEVITSAVS